MFTPKIKSACLLNKQFFFLLNCILTWKQTSNEENLMCVVAVSSTEIQTNTGA